MSKQQRPNATPKAFRGHITKKQKGRKILIFLSR